MCENEWWEAEKERTLYFVSTYLADTSKISLPVVASALCSISPEAWEGCVDRNEWF